MRRAVRSRVRVVLSLLVFLALIGVAVRPGHAVVPTGPPTFSNPLAITNPFQPFQPGGVKVFSGRRDSKASIIVDIYLSRTRTFKFNGASVPCAIVQETEFEGGQLIEVSQNFFAQADDGSVYYFGELVNEYDSSGAIVSHEGSWLVGGPTEATDPPETANASQPGLFMPGRPQVGDVFKPEDLFPVVDETVTVQRARQTVSVPAGRFFNAIQVQESTRLDNSLELKWYAPGVGVVKGQTSNEDFSLIATTLRQ